MNQNKKDPNNLAYETDLNSGILDKYDGKYVAYTNGSVIEKDGSVFYSVRISDLMTHLRNSKVKDANIKKVNLNDKKVTYSD